MANQEQLDILKEGVEVWNAWRAENKEVRVDLSGANLTRADLTEANLQGAYLSLAILTGAFLAGANLNETNLTGADVRGADLRWVTLNRATLREANVEKANLWDTIFADTHLSDIEGLATCIHSGPSMLDHRTLTNNPNLPESFLRGCGLSDLDIEAYRLKDPSLSTDQVDDILYRMHDLRIGGAISYHSYFISYSSKDDDVAHKLHTDLQENGVRCWFAPKDLPIGARIRVALDQAIHLQDKLLLILSEHSVQSPRGDGPSVRRDRLLLGLAEERLELLEIFSRYAIEPVLQLPPQPPIVLGISLG